MAINRARLRGIMVSSGIAAEAPALEFTEALDEEIDASQGNLATKQDLAALEDRIRLGNELQTNQLLRHFTLLAVALASIMTAIISLVIAFA